MTKLKSAKEVREGQHIYGQLPNRLTRERIEICERAEVCPSRFRLNVLDQIAEVERYKKMHLEETQMIDREQADR